LFVAKISAKINVLAAAAVITEIGLGAVYAPLAELSFITILTIEALVTILAIPCINTIHTIL